MKIVFLIASIFEELYFLKSWLIFNKLLLIVFTTPNDFPQVHGRRKVHEHMLIMHQWSVNQYSGIGKYLFILQISIMYRFMENSLISISMLSIKKYILIYWYFQYFTVPFLKSHESFISRVFMKFNTPEASSTHSERLFIGEN